MKKILFFATVGVAMALTSCNSSPRDFAQSQLDLAKEGARLNIDLYEAAAKSKDTEFMQKYEEKLDELHEKNSEYNAVKKKLEKAEENYKEMLDKEWS